MEFHNTQKTILVRDDKNNVKLSQDAGQVQAVIPVGATEALIEVDVVNHTDPTSELVIDVEQLIKGVWKLTSRTKRNGGVGTKPNGSIATECGKGTAIRNGATEIRASVSANKDVTNSRITLKVG